MGVKGFKFNWGPLFDPETVCYHHMNGKKQVNITNQPLLSEDGDKISTKKKIWENCSVQIKTGSSLNACFI